VRNANDQVARLVELLEERGFQNVRLEAHNDRRQLYLWEGVAEKGGCPCTVASYDAATACLKGFDVENTGGGRYLVIAKREREEHAADA